MGTTTRADIALIALKANTASLALTASYFSGSISNATSASYADTASYFSGSITNAVSASYALTSSFALTASFVATASWANNVRSASFASTASYFSGSISNAISSSYAATSSVILVTQNSGEGGGFPIVYSRGTDAPVTLLSDSASLQYNPASNLLTTTASRAVSASRADTATTANRISVTSDTTTNDFLEVLFTNVTGPTVDVNRDSIFNFNPSTNKLFVPNISSSTITGSSFTGSFTGSLFGTASWAQSASQATSASYILNAISSSFATSASFASTASFFSGSVSNAISASYALSASIAATASFFSGSISNATSASYAVTAGLAQRIEVTDLSGAGGQYEILFVDSSGSQIAYAELGNFYYIPINDTLFVDNINVSQSLTARGVSLTGSFSGSLVGTASWAVSSSQAISASRATTSSFAISASWAPGGSSTPTFPYTGSAIISGSLILTGSLNTTGSVFFIGSNTNIVSTSSYISNDFFLIRNATTSLSVNSGVQITSSANTPLQVLDINNNNLLQVSQSGIVIYATSSVTPTGTAPNGALLFTSASLFIGLD